MNGQLSNTSMDTTPIQSSDSASTFARSPHDVSPLLSNHSPHLMRDMPAMFPSSPDQSNVLANVMPADVMASSAQPLGHASGFLSDFQQQCDSFRISIGIDSDMAMSTTPIHPPAPDSQVNSSAMHAMTTGYSVGTSSLATALDSMSIPLSRSRAGSTTSPVKPLTAISPPAFMNGSTIDPAGVPFPPADFTGGVNDCVDPASEVRAEQLMVNVGHALTSVAGYTAGFSETAHSASNACFVGQSAEVSAMFGELKKRWSVITELISKIDASLSLNESSPPQRHTTVAVPATATVTPTLMSMISPPPIESHPMDIHINSDTSDGSRKRCASSVASGLADRVIKAPKMEPVDDATIPISTSPTKSTPISPPPPPHLFSPSAVSVSSVVNRSLPPSAPSSRPPTPPVTMNVNLLQQSFRIVSPSVPPVEFSLPSAVPSQSAFPIGARNRSSWSDSGGAALPHRHHQHSLSGTALNTTTNIHGLSMIPSTSTQPFTAPGTFGTPSLPTLSKQRTAANASNALSPPLGRITRSGSITAPAVNSLSFGFSEIPHMDSYDIRTAPPVVAPQRVSPESDEGDETEEDVADAKSNYNHSSPESGFTCGHSNEVPQEYRAEVDRIFFEFLNRICSNLDASDSKGEPIHQTLMAKKMQRLDESPDFRPFKFRIAAFTNAFLEELASQGYPEEKIPMKKIRNYLWRQDYIQRFNEDGKKAKSKGNHIWNIDAKKGRDGGWIFRPFHRRLAGSPPGIAYVGLKWSWTPRIWDPQASSSHLPVRYNSPKLPHWLSWKDDVLSGTPPPDAESCDITAEARFMRDGQEEMLSLTFHLNIAPISTLDTSFSPSRRPSLATLSNTRRVQSDSVVPQVAPRSSLRPLNPSNQPPPSSQGAQVMQVLTSAAQRVQQEAQSQVITSRSPSEPNGHELRALAKQQHVLTMTAAAFDKEFTGPYQEGVVQSPSSVLAAAAQEVVLQAARTVRADRSAVASVVAGVLPQDAAVTVNEVSVATQSAVAQAVELTGPLSSEVDVLRTATSLLQQHAPMISPAESLPTATLQSRILPLGGISGSVFHPSMNMQEYVPPS